MPRKKKNENKSINEEVYTGAALDFSDLTLLTFGKDPVKATFLPDEINKQRPKKYSKDQIRRFMENPQMYERQLREVSNYFLLTSMHYKRIINYFSNMLTWDYFVMPCSGVMDNIKNMDSFMRNYEKSSKYMENFNVKHEMGNKIVPKLLVEGIFFGYERRSGDSCMIQMLPTEYCKITGLEDGVWTFAFNFQYFQGNKLKLLSNYPEEFTTLYNVAVNTGEWWQELSIDKGAICFKFDETVLYSVPPLTGIFEDVIDLEDYKEMTKQRTNVNNYKLLVQKIPMKKDAKNEKDFVITLDSVKQFHDNIKKALPPGVGLVTTPMEIQDYNFEKSGEKEDTVWQAERSFYSSAGVPNQLFNSEKSGTIGLKKSIETDESFMFPLLRQAERFFKKRLSQINTGSYKFMVLFPDLTVYNRADMLDKYIKIAQYGMPKLFIATALGLSGSQINTLSKFENEFLKIIDLFVPLKSSHTTTGTGESGRPQKNEDDLSDSGLDTRDNEKNDNRAEG